MPLIVSDIWVLDLQLALVFGEVRVVQPGWRKYIKGSLRWALGLFSVFTLCFMLMVRCDLWASCSCSNTYLSLPCSGTMDSNPLEPWAKINSFLSFFFFLYIILVIEFRFCSRKVTNTRIFFCTTKQYAYSNLNFQNLITWFLMYGKRLGSRHLRDMTDLT